jgi:hypothetical protein
MKKEKRQLTEIQVERRMKVLDTLKSLIFPVVLCLVVAIGIYLIIHIVNVEEEHDEIVPRAYAGEEQEIVLENDELKLTLNTITTNFTVLQKKTGKVWSSCADNAEEDTKALNDEKGKMLSNVVLSYAVTNGLETIYNCHDYSVTKGVYEIEADENEIKLLYSIGNIEKEFIIPPVITETDFLALQANMDQEGKNYIKDYYSKYDINNLRKKDNKEELLELYPVLETDVIYVLRAETKEARKAKMEEIFEAAGYTYEQYLENKELDNSASSSDRPVFNLEMDLRLEGNDLVVEIPYSSLEYRSDCPIYTITPLPYFGAADQNEDDGFLFVPEGGGSIINYNNGKYSQNTYYANVYGWDMCLMRNFVVHNTRNYFNVFGQSCDGSSYICVMEGGAPYASVQAGVSGMVSNYNYVNAVYSICQREDYNVSTMANAAVYAYLKELPDESIIQRYTFINSGDYVDMAVAYREYLEDEYGDYLTLNDETEVPLAVEVVGAIDKVQQVVGVPVSLPLKLTSYKGAANIITDLHDSGVNNLSVKFTGWCNGGVSQKMLSSVRLISALGTSGDLKKLTKTADELGVDLYLDGITQYAHRSNIFNGFNSFTDAARQLTKQRAELFHLSHVTYSTRTGFKSYYLLHTSLAQKMANNLVAAADKYGANVSFQDIGMDLSSDFTEDQYHSREQVMKLNQELLKSLDSKKVMINMGNDYAVPYVDLVTNMDLKGSGYTLIDAEVPFYQIAIHGYVDYTGNPINICGNDQEELLRCVEYGAGLYFTVTEESSFAIQKTLYPEYYACEYDSWKDRMLEMYNRYNEELGHTFNQEMTGHEVLSPYVYCTSYADGTKVYVNYSYADDFTAPDGTVVPKRDYTVVR